MKDEREIDTKELSKSKRKTPKNNDFIENKKEKSYQKADTRRSKIKQIRIRQIKKEIKT